MTSTWRPRRGTRIVFGQTRSPPRIVTGRIGTPDSKAIRTAPGLNLPNDPSGLPRPPSGNITTAPPSRSHRIERLIAVGSLFSTCSGQAPSHLNAFPTTGQPNASSHARNLTGRFTGEPTQNGST